MSEPQTTEETPAPVGHEALFAQLVMQQANMALMFLGKVAQPESGETIKDPDAARLFIDELEMLEVKTRGNLTKAESGLLKQTLMSLRLAFVEAVEAPQAPGEPAPASRPSEAAPATPAPGTAPGGAGAGTGSPPIEEHAKKFSKKY
jgi:hypothetical protein